MTNRAHARTRPASTRADVARKLDDLDAAVLNAEMGLEASLGRRLDEIDAALSRLGERLESLASTVVSVGGDHA